MVLVMVVIWDSWNSQVVEDKMTDSVTNSIKEKTKGGGGGGD